jgi:DNA-binding FadR family transcriptional regulator
VELMARTGVGRSSVREAIRSLATMQLVEIQRGRGTFVRAIDPGGVTDAQVLLMLADKESLRDLVEVRLVLEPTIARLAAERATDADIEDLRRAIEGMHRARRHAEWRRLHLDFHQALAAATHNVILTKMWSLVQMFLKDSPMVSGQPSRSYVHGDLMDAIACHDVARAETAMRAHLTDVTRVLE